MNYQKHCLVTSKNQRETLSHKFQNGTKRACTPSTVLSKDFSEKDIKPIQKEKQIKNEKET